MAPSLSEPEETQQREPLSSGTATLSLPDFESFPDKYGWTCENEHGYRIQEQLCGTERPLRVVCAGAGVSGICLAKFLPERLRNVELVCYDKNPDIGGTWWENRYPGCACDIPSVNYQYTWARNPNWSHFYSSAPEIWQYLRDVADRFDLMKYFKLSHEIVGAYWDNGRGVWDIHVKNLVSGETFVDSAHVFINGAGLLNQWKWPDIEGLHSFEGGLCHTARYDENIILDGKRVAVIGAGSSGVQIIANIASKVSKLHTWIRSPTWITPGFAQKYAGPNGANFEYTQEQKTHWAENYLEYLKHCKEIEDELNQRFKFILNGTPEAEEAKRFSTNEMRRKLAGREDLMAKMIPTTFGVGCRRPTPGNGFLEALTLPHVSTYTGEIKKITPKGFINESGEEHEVDVIICGTGFNTSWIPRFPIEANGKNVQDLQARKPVSYLAIGVPEIPNYFTVAGPYGPLGHGSIIPLIEKLLSNFILVIKKMQIENIKSLAPKRSVCEKFVEHADLFLKRTAWSSGCSSWFKQGRKDGPLTMWPGSRLLFLEAHKEPRYEDYDIEYISGNPFGYLGNGFSLKEFDGSDLSFYLGTVDNPGALMPPPRSPETAVNGNS